MQKYSIDESFFKKIDSEAKAYWLGFITADGGIAKSSKKHKTFKLQINLGIKDINHLRKFKSDVGSEAPVLRIKDKGKIISRLNICSQPLIQSLFQLGVTTKKSFTVRPPNKIPKKLMKHYWRGLVDGDGCIFKDGKKWGVELLGSKYIIDGFIDFVLTKIRYKLTRNKKGKIFKARTAGNVTCPKIITLLYRDSNIYLTRKKKIANYVMKRVA